MLVTGGAGFIGSHLSESLLERGHQVTVLDNLSTGSHENIAHLHDHPRFRFVLGSVGDQELVDRLSEDCQVIFHLAAAVGVELIVSDPVQTIETNILGTDTVLRAANRQGRKVLIASTSEIYGKNGKVPFNEEDDRLLGSTTKARWSYSSSKAIDEFLALAYYKQMGLPVVIFRLFNTIGPRQRGQYGMVVPRFIQQALEGKPLTVYDDGLQTRCFCDVEDVVEGILRLESSPAAVGQVFNLGSTEEITILELAERILTQVGSLDGHRKSGADMMERIQFIPYQKAYEEGFEDMRRRVPDTGKIKNAVGWQPRKRLEETLGDIVSWHLERESATGVGNVSKVDEQPLPASPSTSENR